MHIVDATVYWRICVLVAIFWLEVDAPTRPLTKASSIVLRIRILTIIHRSGLLVGIMTYHDIKFQ